jgi:6-phosphogluconolactonase
MMKKHLLLYMAILAGFVLQAQNKATLFVGTYTSGDSKGIYVFEFDSQTGHAVLKSTQACSNPSFLAVSPNNKYVYAVNEDGNDNNTGGGISAFGFNKRKKRLTPINTQLTKGNHPCYVSVDNTGQWVIAGNYSGGSFSIFKIRPNGGLDSAHHHTVHSGRGANAARQEKPHVHATYLSADNRFLLVPDLGIDKLQVYQFDATTGNASFNNGSIAVAGGAGPRHVTIHPSLPYAYLVQELTGTVAVFSWNGSTGQLKLLQTISAVPEGYKGSFGGADIHISPNGKFLYSSNRGELNDIATFKIDETNGTLEYAGSTPVLGFKPRNFCFDPSGKFLLVANQDANHINIFSWNEQTGQLNFTGKTIAVPAPVCLVWGHSQ